MIEVFKTTIENPIKAGVLIDHIISEFPNYEVNFDLDDSDRILRIANSNGIVEVNQIIVILSGFGEQATLLT